MLFRSLDNQEGYSMKKLRGEVGLVFQYPEHQLFEIDVMTDVCFGPKNQGLSREECENRALEALRLVGLDVFYKKELILYLKSLNKTIIIVSHDLDFVGDIADYVSFLSDGVITLAGERRQVLSSLSYYTTQVRRITASRLTSAVSTEDLL